MKTQLILVMLFSAYLAFSQNPIADFEVNVDYKCGYATTEFINNSENADVFLWDVRGTGYFIEVYEPVGSNLGGRRTWTVTLIAKQNGLSDTLSKEVEVFNSMVQYEMSALDTNSYAPFTVEFLNTSEVREGDDLIYQWDFGDGTQSDEINATHTYDLPNTYHITLIGTKSDGCELSYSDFVIVKDTSQRGEFEFLTTDCLDEFETPPCGYDKHYKLIHDSLIVYGFYYGNCGTQKTATVRYSGDTVKIKTWEVGLLATCSCGYCFEIAIPNITNDSTIVTFDGDILQSATNINEQEIEKASIIIFPNPAHNYITLNIENVDLNDFEYKILNVIGQVLKVGKLNGESQIELGDIEKGVYILRVSNENNEYLTRFIKE